MNIIQAVQSAILAAALAVSTGAAAQDKDRPATKTDKAARQATPESAAKSDTKSAGKQGSALSAQDRQFIIKAAQSGHAEVETGKLAAAQASDSAVKQFGEKMVQDHGKANEELAQIAKSKGVEPPMAPDARHQKLAARLKGLKGAEFDRVYVREAGSKDHGDAVKLFESQAKRGKDPELKAFAEKTLPVIQEHHRMAKELASRK